MGIGDVIILAALAVWGCAVLFRRRGGHGGCGGDCTHCSGCNRSTHQGR